MICLILQILYKILHINTFWYNFDTVLYQFLETGTSDRCLICLNQLPRFSGFRLYPLSFFLYSPFNTEQLEVSLEFRFKVYIRYYFLKFVLISFIKQGPELKFFPCKPEISAIWPVPEFRDITELFQEKHSLKFSGKTLKTFFAEQCPE